jgi:transposase
VSKLRQDHGKKEKTSFGIVDAQSVKNSDSARVKGYDAGKKVSGIKRHIVVDTQGLIHAASVTTANVNDRQGAIEAIKAHQEALSEVQAVLADSGYTGEPFANQVAELLSAQVQIAKRHQLHTFKVLPKRWVVERTFAWLQKYRRLWKNCERSLLNSLQALSFVSLAILLKRF